MVAGTSDSTSVDILDGATSYMVETDADEIASAVTTSVISSSTGDEVPQQQAVIESQGGGGGQVTVTPGTQVTINTSVSGADSTFGITGR